MADKNIQVYLNTPATKPLAQELQPDVIISALGSKAVEPVFIKGYNGENIIQAEEVYKDISLAKDNVVVLGGGLVGIELAIYLAQHGRQVSVIEMLPAPNFGDNVVHAGALMGTVMQCGIHLALGTRALEVTETGIIGADTSGSKLFEADTVISALGLKPLTEEVEELRFCAPEFYEIGTSNSVTTIAKATCEAYYAALNIGR